MTLTFGIATRARLGAVAQRPTGAIGATQGTSTTTWATTPRAGTRRGSAVPRLTSSTATRPAGPTTSATGVSAPRCALITAARPGAAVTAATRTRVAQRWVPKNLRS